MEDRLKKRKRVSKKNKKAWRKHSDVKDIEEEFAERQHELRTGGVISEKADSSLFFVDKAKVSKTGPRTKQEWRQKALKCYQSITPDPSVPAAPKGQARGKKSTKNQNAKTPLQILKEKEEILRKRPVRARNLEHATKQRQSKKQEIEKREKEEEDPTVTHDLWSEGPKDDTVSKRLEGADEHFLRSTKRTRVKLPTRYYKKPSKISAVETPDPGTSYNPSFEDHQNLLKKYYDLEKRELQKEKAVEKWFDYEKVSAKNLEVRYMTEMSAGLFDEAEGAEDASEVGEADAEDTKVLPNPPALAEARKTKRQRRIEREQKEAERLKAKEKVTNIRMNDVYRLRGLKREVEAEETGRAVKRKRKLQRKAEKAGGTKKLGKYRYEAPPDAFKLTSQLTGSLRKLKPEGNAINDRYRHFTKRNMLEARIHKRNPKPLMKEFEKRGHKEIIA